MAETTITFRVDKTLKKQFRARVNQLDRDGSQVLRAFMRSFVADEPNDATAYDTWYRASVQEALDDPRKPIASATVEKRFASLRATALRRKSTARAR
jgi:antitoxin component of RelBE/YafQ-DinJ toxin-antitoxin module